MKIQLLLALSLLAIRVLAQNGVVNTNDTVVTVVASDASASETGTNTGAFSIARTGSTSNALSVFFALGGTASNGVDYQTISNNNVVIPAGERYAKVWITPIDDTLVEGSETVIIRLVASPVASPVPQYRIGSPAEASITISDNDFNAPSNQPPTVTITSPSSNSVFTAPANISLIASPRDSDGYIAKVEYFAGSNSLGIVTRNANLDGDGGVGDDGENRWRLVWSNAPAGSFAIRAIATDDDGATGASAPVNIVVREPELRPTVNVYASDSEAAEATNGGSFRFVRSGNTNVALSVHYGVSGTASNGVDYAKLSGVVEIAAGVVTATVPVTLIDDSIVEGTETVTITIQAPVCAAIVPPPPECYLVGAYDHGTIYIRDNDFNAPSNHPPTVTITSPGSNSVFTAPANISLIASPRDSDGYITKVEYFAGSNSLGIVTRNANLDGDGGVGEDGDNRWRLVWSNAPAGSFAIRAIATDDDGATGASAPVNIVVREPELRPTVNVYAGDSEAAEATNGGSFRFVRSGNTNVALSVHYGVGGTASNGVDYARLSGVVEIAAGVVTATVPVTLIDDSIVEGTETVTITIQAPVCAAIVPPPPECYLVGSYDHATIYIRDNDTQPVNASPTVMMLSPENGATFTGPLDIALRASAQDREDGNNITVEFFEGTHRLGAGVFVPTLCPSPNCPYFALVWSNVPPGEYVLKAKATDQLGAMGWSEPVKILVRATNTPPAETNHPPVVRVHAADAYAVEGPTIYCWTNTWQSNSPPRDGTPIGAVNTNNFTTVYCRTNSETNVAVFKISRSGSTSNALTVGYSLCGTASNGVDYVELPGTVTIPAGRHSAEVVITPIDDRLAEGIETVILMLTPPLAATNAPLPYSLGWPNKAGAIIVDNDVPRPRTTTLREGLFHLCAPATNGFNHRLEFSTNLIHWIPVYTNRVMDGAVQFVDPETPLSPHRFYRWMEDPNSDPD